MGETRIDMKTWWQKPYRKSAIQRWWSYLAPFAIERGAFTTTLYIGPCFLPYLVVEIRRAS